MKNIMLVTRIKIETTNMIIFQILCFFPSINETVFNITDKLPIIKLGIPKYAINAISPMVVPSLSSWSAKRCLMTISAQKAVNIKHITVVIIPIIHKTMLDFSFLDILGVFASWFISCLTQSLSLSFCIISSMAKTSLFYYDNNIYNIFKTFIKKHGFYILPCYLCYLDNLSVICPSILSVASSLIVLAKADTNFN